MLPLSITTVAVRWLHLLGMALLVGGAVLVWAFFRTDPRDDAALALATSYEWLFWAAAGVLALTGVGNLGALAPAVPGPGTRWGAVFTAKLVVVFAFLAFSLVRTLGVSFQRSAETPRLDPLRASYGATVLALLAVVALAEVLAHG